MVSKGCGKGFFANESTHELLIWPAGNVLQEGNKYCDFLGLRDLR